MRELQKMLAKVKYFLNAESRRHKDAKGKQKVAQTILSVRSGATKKEK